MRPANMICAGLKHLQVTCFFLSDLNNNMALWQACVALLETFEVETPVLVHCYSLLTVKSHGNEDINFIKKGKFNL